MGITVLMIILGWT